MKRRHTITWNNCYNRIN